MGTGNLLWACCMRDKGRPLLICGWASRQRRNWILKLYKLVWAEMARLHGFVLVSPARGAPFKSFARMSWSKSSGITWTWTFYGHPSPWTVCANAAGDPVSVSLNFLALHLTPINHRACSYWPVGSMGLGRMGQFQGRLRRIRPSLIDAAGLAQGCPGWTWRRAWTSATCGMGALL